MIQPGSQVTYCDFAGYVDSITKTDIWIITRDLVLVGIPADSAHITEVDALPPPTAEERETMKRYGIEDAEPVVEPKLFLKAGFIRLAKGRNHPSGTYKIIAGGMGQDKEELQQAIRYSGYKSATHRLAVVSWNEGEGYFAIEVSKS